MSTRRRQIVCRGVLAASLVGALAACGRGGDPGSQAASVYETAEIELVTDDPAERAGASAVWAASGSLQAVVEDPNGGDRAVFPYCSGFAIGPRHMLTAAHCATRAFVFDRFYRARPGGALAFMTFGAMVRLTFDGELDERSEATARSGPVLEQPALVDASLDFAIFELPAAARTPVWVDLRQAEARASEAVLYGYPNGVPLAAARCHELSPLGAAALAHDCDALSGSSGGLIVSRESLRPIAMHLAGAAHNDAAQYQSRGSFESAVDFARRRGCAVDAVSGRVDPACVLQRGYNRAIPLTVVREAVERESPELWRAIVEAADDGGSAS